MNIKTNYSLTKKACYIAYVVQAMAVNFAPLLYLTFMNSYGISYGQISLIIITTFVVQVVSDLLSPIFINKIGYRKLSMLAHTVSAIGFIMLGILPNIFENAYIGIMVACFFYSLGSGLIEALVSPIVEACPSEHKESAMGILHSFFCWGSAAVILAATLFFVLFGTDKWYVFSICLALVPIFNFVLFIIVPMPKTENVAGGSDVTILSLLKRKIIWVVVILMFLSGATELAMSQWASVFAESGLGVSKTFGDIMGPFMFAVMMGTGRIVYSIIVKKVPLLKYMTLSAILCVVAYLTAALCKNPVIALIGCGISGFAVGVFWPGTFSYATQKCPDGGASLFGLLAFSGDMGCMVIPALVGVLAGIFKNGLKTALLVATLCPLALFLISFGLSTLKKRIGK